MFFKNVFVFAFTRPFTTSWEDLELAVAENKFTPCASTELSHFGFHQALGKHGQSFTHSVDGNVLFCARKEEKILPAPVIKDYVDERIEQLESEQARTATKKEREQIKEDVIFELLPRAFSRVTDTHAYINAKENIIVINTASRGKAEDVLALLRKALGTLPVTSVSPEKAPDEVMTDWVLGLNSLDEKEHELGLGFSFGMEATFNSLGDQSASAVVKNHDLSGTEVNAHLDADQYVTKLALEYDDSISFMLHDDLSIKRIKFSDVIQEQNDDFDSDDVLARLDADFALMAGELNRMIGSLHAEFSVSATDYLEE